jgi:hypothetical protein
MQGAKLPAVLTAFGERLWRSHVILSGSPGSRAQAADPSLPLRMTCAAKPCEGDEEN